MAYHWVALFLFDLKNDCTDWCNHFFLYLCAIKTK